MVDDSKPMLQSDGPLRAVAFAQHATTDGSFSKLQLAFTTADRAAFAVIPLGDTVPADAILSVAWYKLNGTGERQLLFSTAIPVGAGGRAFSEAVAARGFAPGTYEAVARLGERQVRTAMFVRVANAASVPALPESESLAKARPVSLSTPEDWDLPSEGETWYSQNGPPDGQPPSPRPCEADTINASLTPMTDVTASVFFLGQCSFRSLSATVAGATRRLASDDTPQGPLSSLYGVVDVCEAPGGSDMPGTVVHFAATGSDGAAATEDYVLPDLGEIGPVVGLETDPPAGTRVKAGDIIVIRALALLLPPALGIETLYVSAGDDLVEAVGNASGSTSPVPCDLGRFVALLGTRYEVPSDPPPILILQADGVDFAGRQGSASTATAAFPTVDGEIWEGTISGELQTPGCSAYAETGSLLFLVDGEGVIRGTSQVTADAFACGSNGGIPARTVETAFSGRKTDRITLTFPDGVELTSEPIRDGKARIIQDFGIGPVTMELTCRNCAD